LYSIVQKVSSFGGVWVGGQLGTTDNHAHAGSITGLLRGGVGEQQYGSGRSGHGNLFR
jgi:hypothetical protein